jgi:hypothetical protein
VQGFRELWKLFCPNRSIRTCAGTKPIGLFKQLLYNKQRLPKPIPFGRSGNLAIKFSSGSDAAFLQSMWKGGIFINYSFWKAFSIQKNYFAK